MLQYRYYLYKKTGWNKLSYCVKKGGKNISSYIYYQHKRDNWMSIFSKDSRRVVDWHSSKETFG